MKITSQEEYGIRLLLQIGNNSNSEGMTIPQLSAAEGLSQHYVAKLCRILRISGFIRSSRGKDGGYTLALAPSQIRLNTVLSSLGGKLFSQTFCNQHTGLLPNCRRSCECSVKSVWEQVQHAVDQVLDQFSLQDLMEIENHRERSSLTPEDWSSSAQVKKSSLASKL